jgi:hypothetical protein
VLRYDIAFRLFQENVVDVGTPGPGIGDMSCSRTGSSTTAARSASSGVCTITALLDGTSDPLRRHGQPGRGPDRVQGLSPTCRTSTAVVGGTGAIGTRRRLTVLELGNDGTLTVRLSVHSGR